MANPADLLFARPPLPTPGPVPLVFGDDGGGPPPIPDATLSGGGRVTGLRLHLVLRAGTQLAGGGRVTGLRLRIAATYDADVSRSLLVRAAPTWQDAAPRASALRSRWQDAGALSIASAVRWQRAAALAGGTRARWQASLGLQTGTRVLWQLGLGAAAALRAPFEEARALRTSTRMHWQRAAEQPIATRIGFQQTLALTRTARAHWQHAVPRLSWWALHNLPAAPRHTAWRPLWQEALPPRPGGTVRHPIEPPTPEPCYLPLLPAHLVFDAPWTGDTHLVFVCEREGGPGPGPNAPITVARRRSYIVINSIEVRRVDTDQLLPALDQGLSMQLDRGSWTWGFTVSFHASALPLLQPAPDGTPVALLLTVNGQPFRMVVESIARSVRFPAAHLTVRGRGRAALLDAPYAATRSFGHLLGRTAQQLMEEALTINGASIGWSLDWQIEDWFIPAATWAHQGTWISAVTDIASAVGAYVQPHDTDEVLRILPAWPAPIWGLPDATPDIELPPGIATVEETEWVTQPDYDALYLHGEPGISLYYRKRAGTAGDSLAPMAVHPLLVHADAARQRALAELSETGRQVEHQLQLMVLPETGIIRPGTLLRYTDDTAVTRTGITRAVSVAMSGPTLTQTIKVQAHA